MDGHGGMFESRGPEQKTIHRRASEKDPQKIHDVKKIHDVDLIVRIGDMMARPK